MPLAAGTKLDSYEILGLLGAGGMGEVYRARDRGLKREVAIKVLPSFVSGNPDCLRRFRQEAQAAAALDHPNILAVHQFGDLEGAPYFVTELLTGESLRQALQRGPLPVRKAIDYGIQIANGLAAAHNHGIIHRDLKPDNLFATRDGRIKILDFGLAKLKQRQQESSGSATTRAMGTDPGMVMGTVGYMSPEQVRAQAVDHRTDIFALGAVFYEMLTGRRAFQRPTAAETMTAILNDDPPPMNSPTGANIPPTLQRVVNRCLEKDPEQRFHSASDLAFALDALSDSGASSAIATQAPPLRSQGRTLVWSIALVTVILLVAVAWFEMSNRNSAPPLRISEYTQLTHNGHAGYVLGSDGSRLYLQDNNRASISQVSVSGGEIEPVSFMTVPKPLLVDVSPGGSTLLVASLEKGFTLSWPLYAVQAVGGSHRYLADAVTAAWSPDGKLVAYSTPNGDLNLINSDGTDAHKLASVGGVAAQLSWSPDGGTIRFYRGDPGSLWEITGSGSNLHALFPGWYPSAGKCCGRWSPDGEFFAFLAGPAGPYSQIYAFDDRRGLFRRASREPFQLTSGPIDWGTPVFSKDGKIIFATGSTKAGELVRLDSRSNQFQPFLGGISADSLAFSKDGQFVAYISYPDFILWRANRDGSDRVQLSSPPLQPAGPEWSPDGTQIIFSAPSPQGWLGWIVSAEGGSPQRLLPDDKGQQTTPSWSPDGRRVAFGTNAFQRSTNESRICVLDLASHQVTTLPGSDGKFAPHWSPDGQFIKAQSLDLTTLYIFDTRTQHWSAQHLGLFAYAIWSKDSRSIYFFRYAEDPAILRIPVTGGETKVVVGLKGFPFTGTPGLWFGLDPDDAPLMLRDASTSDVYALTLERK